MRTLGVGLLALIACGGDGSTPDAAHIDAPHIDAPHIDATGSGSACNSLTQAGSSVAEIDVAAPEPVGSGSAIPDGTYILVGWDKYTGSGGAAGSAGMAEAQTTTVSSLHTQSVLTVNGVTSTQSYTLATTGSGALTVTQTCPTTGTLPLTRFTQAAGNVITLYATDGEALTYMPAP
jgi:hypothetical protein